jgi:multidrug efflux pump subunit AcrB
MTAVLTLSVILFGVMSYFQLPVNDLPAVDYPVIQVTVGYPGASPDTIASNIATPLERQFMQINGLEVVTSKSAQGIATFTLQFALEKNIDAAATDVQTAISQARGSLPAIFRRRRLIPRAIPTTNRSCTSRWSATPLRKASSTTTPAPTWASGSAFFPASRR